MPLEIDKNTKDEHHAHARKAYMNEGSPVFQSVGEAETKVSELYSTQKDRDMCYILHSKTDDLWFVLHGPKPYIFDDADKWIKKTTLIGRINESNVD